jgi:hypothetical protein
MRVKYDWNVKIQEYKDSGMGIAAWCRSQGIPDSTFSYHLHKEKPSQSTKFIELKDSSSGITISCQGLSIEIHPSFDASTLQKFLKVLTSLC